MTLSLKEGILCAGKLPRDDQVIMGRAELLSTEDRNLIEAVVLHGQTAESLARLMGVSGRTIRRRVERLMARLASREFLQAARVLPYLAEEDARLARLAFCQQRSQRWLARHLNVTSHCLRRRLDQLAARIETLHKVMNRQRRETA